RNFNVWWTEQGRDLGRTDYGVRLYKENSRGRNETLRFVFQLGYTQKFELRYKIPYIDKKMRFGLEFGASYSRNKEVAYETAGNKQQFHDEDRYIRQRVYTGIGVSYRKAIHNQHEVSLIYRQNQISDSLAYLNANYFGDSITNQRNFHFGYVLKSRYTDRRSYPTKGIYNEFRFFKSGLGIFNDVNIIAFINSFNIFYHILMPIRATFDRLNVMFFPAYMLPPLYLGRSIV
ncbi:MAG: BamA/TamA family outer membrane protein, partial [Bacteroidetes bacterium]|nr:BamA/TamA family outer membrane protein [Bacteroidota bacterium]